MTADEDQLDEETLAAIVDRIGDDPALRARLADQLDPGDDTGSTTDGPQEHRMSRRGFMKAAGLGAAGLGLASATGMDVPVPGQHRSRQDRGTVTGMAAAQSGGQHTLELQPEGEEPVNYAVQVNGEIQAADGTEAEDATFGNQAQGTVRGDTDTYQYEGQITRFNADGPLTIMVDGEELTAGELAAQINKGCAIPQPPQDGGGGTGGAGAIVAQPGEIQGALDDAASSQGTGGMVVLDPSQEYVQPASPIHVPRGVTLDFNGAVLKGHGGRPEVDLFHVHPGGQIYRPQIDLFAGRDGYAGGNKYRGNVFTLSAEYGPYFSDGTTIQGGWTRSVQSTGNWIYVTVDDAKSDNNWVSFIDIHSSLSEPPGDQFNTSPPSFETAIRLDSRTDGDGWMNSIRFGGNWRSANTTIVQQGGQPNNAHEFNAFIQPPNTAQNVWRIESGAFARRNILRGKVWDLHQLNGPAWRIDSTFDQGGNQATRMNTIATQRADFITVENNSGMVQYLRDLNSGVTKEV